MSSSHFAALEAQQKKKVWILLPFALHLNASDWQERFRIIGVMQLISYVMLNDNKMFDVVVAADLRSIEIEMPMSNEGVAM